jgi:multiple sugar transport system permease protein
VKLHTETKKSKQFQPLYGRGLGDTPIGALAGKVLLVSYAVVCVFPFFWAFLVSLTPLTWLNAAGEQAGVDIMRWPPDINLFKLKVFGVPATFANYLEIFKVVPWFGRWFLNTIVFATLVTIGTVFFNTLAAYAFARLRFPFRDFWFTLFLATLMVPTNAIMIPLYTLLIDLGFVNTYQGLILPKFINVGILFFMRQFFIDFPLALEEAAHIDGASIPRIFFNVVLPNAKAPMAAQGIYVFLGAWNEFMWPLIVTSNKEMYTLTIGLAFFKSSYYTYWQYLMAASLLATLPMVIFFLVFIRQFVGNNISSGIKG